MSQTIAPEPKVTLFHAPHTRATGVLSMLEELGVPYDLEVLDRGRGEHRHAEFLGLNPLGKVPTLRDIHGGIVIEQVAILLYLADLYPQAGLAPKPEEPLRGPYLRWMAFYAASFEPALVDKYRQVEPGQPGMSPYGTYEKVIEMIDAQLATGPYLLGDRFLAADVLWGTALHWTVGFKLVPPTPAISGYVERVMTRPGIARATAIDKQLAAKQKA